MVDLLPWILFLLLVLVAVVVDLGVLARGNKEPSAKKAMVWTVFWITLGLAFSVVVWFGYERHWLGLGATVGHPASGGKAALEYLTGYIVEKSLSLDNIFVFAAIFSYFKVPRRYQHRVLYWGIIGALILRGIMIALGVALIERFDWIVYVFGAILLWTAWKMWSTEEVEIEPEKNPLVRLARRFLPVTTGFREEKLVVKEDGKRYLTPLFIVLLVIESSDILFAVDSIPAVFAVTTDPFLVFTSNVFAILGLRALYFVLAAILEKFRHLRTSLVFLLAYVGVKMIVSHHVKIPTLLSLGIIALILAGGVVASLVADRGSREKSA